MSRRGAVGAGILLLWLAGLGVLAHRELTGRDARQLAEAGQRVTPGASYYAVEQGGVQIGFASSTVDTTPDAVTVVDYVVADVPLAGRLRRATARSTVHLSRTLRLLDFDVSMESEAGPISVSGRADGDTVLVLAVTTEQAPADTQRVRLSAPVLLPTAVPLVFALSRRPEVGKTYPVSLFDPLAMAPREVALRVRAESLFVLSDSATRDAAGGRWRPAGADTVRAWQLAVDSGSTLSGWVDAQGRLVALEQPGGVALRRLPFEVARENWRLDSAARGRTVAADDDILETTAIAASAPLGDRRIDRLRVRLGGVNLAQFALPSERQRLDGDTLTVVREGPTALRATYALPGDAAHRARFSAVLAAEPLLQAEDPRIIALARRIANGARDPRVAAERLNRWVHDSVQNEITFGVPNALQVLDARRGDCNEHTQLYAALARALGIPTRIAAGLAYLSGKFYYHAWPEVYLGRWVAVDPTFGQFPADAAHLRFVSGGLQQQAALLGVIGRLRIDVLER